MLTSVADWSCLLL